MKTQHLERRKTRKAMKMKYLIILILLILANPIIASEIVTTSKGDKVILKDDGTWQKVPDKVSGPKETKDTKDTKGQEVTVKTEDKPKATPYDLMKIKVEGHRQWREAYDDVCKKVENAEGSLRFKGAEIYFKACIERENNRIRAVNKQVVAAKSRREKRKLQKIKNADKEWLKEYVKKYKPTLDPLYKQRSRLKLKERSYKPTFLFKTGSYGHVGVNVLPFELVDNNTLIVEVDGKYIQLQGLKAKDKMLKPFRIYNCLKCLSQINKKILGNTVIVYVCDIIPS